jgi:hypothetical protein
MKNEFLTAGYRYCFICLLSIAVVCGSASDGHAQSYYPDDFGNTWVLRSTDEIDERVITIEGPETIGNELVKVISDQTNDNPNKFFIKTEPDGVLIFRATATIAGFDVSIDYSPPQTFLPVPIELGSEWTLTGQAILLLGLTIETTNVAKVVAVEPITVPAGTFQDCLKIEQELSTSGLITLSQQSTLWLAPDFGFVKAISSDNIVFELIAYDITIDGKEVAVQPKEKLATTWGALKKR